MYKALQVFPGQWFVVWLDTPDAEPRIIPKAVQRPEDEEHKMEPYPQRQAAYRRAKKLNDMVARTNAMIAEKGAIIL